MKSAEEYINKNKIGFNRYTKSALLIFPTFLAICALLIVTVPAALQNPTTNMVNSEFAHSLENFGVKLFSELAKSKHGQNIVFSPFSIQTCVAMARLGAEGKTALEMDSALGLKSQSDESLAENYHSILSLYENSKILKIANRIYVMKDHEVQDKYNELLKTKFFSSAENIDFAQSNEAAKTINNWVESKTNNLIKELIPASALNADTRLVLLNAIYFKGEWVHEFPARSTREADFFLDDTNSVKVQMMRLTERFRYGKFDDLDATALEMPYKDSDLSMLIILPNSRTGLLDLEEKLKSVSLHDLSSQMRNQKVVVDMPKFKAEFSVELNDALSKMGMARMFSSKAEFGKMLKSDEPLQISKAVHKAFIEVNEKGTEAAAATGAVVRRKRALDIIEVIDFVVDHPFVYQIIHKLPISASTASPTNETSNATLPLFVGKIQNDNGGEVAAKPIEAATPAQSNRIDDEL